MISSLLAPLGGAEQYCLEIARGQREAGHELTIITGWASPEVVDALAADGIAVQVVPNWRPYPPDRKGPRVAAALFHGLDLLGSIRTPRRMRRALAADAATGQPWDVVHLHRVAGFGTALLRSTPAPVVFTVHDYSLVDTGAFLVRDGVVPDGPSRVQAMRTDVIRRTLGRTHLVFPSARLRDTHARFGLAHPGTDSVIPHGWRIERPAGAAATPAAPTTPATTASPDAVAGTPATPAAASDGPVVFLFLGKLLTDKGVDLLLEAWGDGIPGAELRFAGAGPDAAAVEDAAAAGRVRMLGWIDEDARRVALDEADVLVLPSLWPENFQLAAAEGVLAGLPIIATTIASPPVVLDGESGLLAEPTPDALRAALVGLLDDTERGRLSAGARARAADLDFDLHLRRIDALYASLGAGCAASIRGAEAVSARVRGTSAGTARDDILRSDARATPPVGALAGSGKE